MTSERPEWYEISGTSSPGGRSWGSLTYDAADGYVLLFGGYSRGNGQNFGDTWTYAGGAWTELKPATSPTPRDGAALAYDPIDGYVVLFGGFSYGGSHSPSSQTWTYLAGTWTLLTPATSPSGRAGAAMTYDAADACLVLFGGTTGDGYLNDTWTFRGGDWTNVATSTAPTPRVQALMAYDGHDGYLLLYGGQQGDTEFTDFWTYSAGGWSQLRPSTSPDLAQQGAMAYDPYSSTVLLFGGSSYDYSSGATWVYTAGAWTQLSPPAAPSARAGAAIAVDTTDGYLVMFGGGTGYGVDRDTWTWEAPLLYGAPTESASYVGQNVTFSVGAQSPAGTIQVDWDPGSPSLGCATSSDMELACSPSAAGEYTVAVSVSDGAGAVTTGSMSVEVALYPAVSVPSPSTPNLDVGQTFELTSTATGGLGSYTWSWTGLPAFCSGLASPTVHCEAASPGDLSVTAVVTDGEGRTATSEPARIAVFADPVVGGLRTSDAVADVGQSYQLSGTVSGGLAPYVWSWGGPHAGCTTPNSSTIQCTASAPGKFTVAVGVTDSTGAVATGSGPEISVFAQPEAKLQIFPGSQLLRGESLALSAEVSYGAGGLRYSWTGLPPGCAVAATSTLNCIPSRTGTYIVNLVVTDRANGTTTAHAKIIVGAVSPPVVPASPALPAPFLPYLGIALAVVVLGVVSVILLHRRSGGGGDSVADPRSGSIAEDDPENRLPGDWTLSA